MPEIIIILRYLKLIVTHVPIKDVYIINIIETKNNLNLLKTNPPITLVMSTEIREDIAQQKVARITKK